MTKEPSIINNCNAAVVTPPGEGGIGVIQVVGAGAKTAVAGLFRSTRKRPLEKLDRLYYGHLIRDDEILDEVLIAVVEEEPDHVLEINCHGGIVAVERVMHALQQAGAQRISAAEAAARGHDAIRQEAATLLPKACSRKAVRMLLEQYQGALSGAIRSAISSSLQEAGGLLAELKGTADFGIALCTPRKIVIAGAPNVGKSTLFNALLGHSRAIVTDIPGTTRDFISDTIVLEGFPFEAIDTAGLRESENIVEQEGVRLSHQQINKANVILFLFDAASGLTADDRQILAQLENAPVPVIRVANKIDLLPDGQRHDADVAISAETGAGLKKLEADIVISALGESGDHDGPVIFTKRQSEAVHQALAAVQKNEDFFREILHELLNSTEL